MIPGVTAATDDIAPGDEDAAWRPMVALRHVRPGRPDHVDWLLARDAAGQRPLRSFRCAVAPTVLAGGVHASPRALGLRAIADHRPRYLDYEGPVSRGPGEVVRLARGRWRPAPGDGDERLDLHWEGSAPHIVTLVTSPGDAVRVAEPPPAEHGGESVLWLLG